MSISSVSDLLAWIGSSANPTIREFLAPDGKKFIARAPGRLDLMGGIADYSGALVLQWPIREATWAIVQPSESDDIQIASVHLDSPGSVRQANTQLSSLSENGEPISCENARQLFKSNPGDSWMAYPAGVFAVLMRERGARFSHGANILIVSDVPEGKGVSSSAALEVSTMTAVAAAFDLTLTAEEIGALSQKVENEVVGAPCGIMDQMGSSCSQKGSLMALRCRPAELLGNVALPDGAQIWGIDSGVRHSVSGADYGTVRAGAFMGKAILQQEGLPCEHYLTELSPSQVDLIPESTLPLSMSGVDFIVRYKGTSDPLSVIDPTRNYPVRASTFHAIHEHFRVNLFRELLQLPITPKRLLLLGELMYEAHNGYSSCGLGTSQTDRLVELVRARSERGLYGAKITGGGSGGTVAVLGESGADDVIDEIASKYESETGLKPYLFTGTSPGAGEYGVTVVGH